MVSQIARRCRRRAAGGCRLRQRRLHLAQLLLELAGARLGGVAGLVAGLEQLLELLDAALGGGDALGHRLHSPRGGLEAARFEGAPVSLLPLLRDLALAPRRAAERLRRGRLERTIWLIAAAPWVVAGAGLVLGALAAAARAPDGASPAVLALVAGS